MHAQIKIINNCVTIVVTKKIPTKPTTIARLTLLDLDNDKGSSSKHVYPSSYFFILKNQNFLGLELILLYI